MRFQEILNQALAENFICLTQKLANPPLKSGSSFLNRDPLFRFRECLLRTVSLSYSFKSESLGKEGAPGAGYSLNLVSMYFWKP